VRLNSSEGANLINIQYGVAFGVIFAFCFYQDFPSSPVGVAISYSNFLPFGLLVVYYFLDWLTANFARDKFNFKDWVVLAWSLSTWYIGSVVILMNSSDNFRYVWLSCYILLVGLFDLFGYRNILYQLTTTRSLLWVLLAGIKTIMGVMLFLLAILVAITGTKGNLHSVATASIAILTIMKYARYELIKTLSRGER